MSMPYPRGLEDRIDAIERRLDQLFASSQNRVPTMQASQGLIFPSQATPDAPPSGGHLHASGSAPYWRNSSGDIALIQTFPQGVWVSDPSNITAGTAPGTYTPSHSAALRADTIEVRATLLALIQSLRGGEIIRPF